MARVGGPAGREERQRHATTVAARAVDGVRCDHVALAQDDSGERGTAARQCIAKLPDGEAAVGIDESAELVMQLVELGVERRQVREQVLREWGRKRGGLGGLVGKLLIGRRGWDRRG